MCRENRWPMIISIVGDRLQQRSGKHDLKEYVYYCHSVVILTQGKLNLERPYGFSSIFESRIPTLRIMCYILKIFF